MAETPTLRLFGPARQAAGISKDVFEASSVDELVRLASLRYPKAFSELLSSCRIWVNGEDAAPDRALRDEDEVAVIPPISGG